MNMSVAPPGFTSQVTLCRLTCDLGSHSWTHPVETLHSVYGLHLCDAAVHKQFRPGDVAAVLGSEKNDRPGDLIGRAKPAERNAGENRLQTLSARSCGRQRVIESGGVGEARAHRVHADAALLQVRRPGPREATYGCLAGAGNATRPQPLAGADGGVQDDRGTLRQQRQRLLHREKQAFHVDVEDRVVELLGDRAQGASLATPALAKTMSSQPFSRLIWEKRRSKSSRFDTSPWTPVTFLPISFTAAANWGSRRPVMKT